MKKILVVFAVLLAIFLVGCPNAPSNNVPEEKASSLKASGATTVPTTEEEIIDVFASAEDMDDDPLVVDIAEFLDSLSPGSLPQRKRMVQIEGLEVLQKELFLLQRILVKVLKSRLL